MSRARVTSIESIDNLYAALARLGKEGEDALAAAAVIIRRTFDTIQECLKRWMREVDRRHEQVQRCKADLSFRKSAVFDNQGATEQEIALKRAQQRLREAEEKVQICRRWLVTLPEALKDFDAPTRMLSGFLQGEYRRALELLKKHSAVLKEYVAMEAPSTEPSTTAAAPPAAAEAETAPPPETGGSA
jgi:hypothetical protein